MSRNDRANQNRSLAGELRRVAIDDEGMVSLATIVAVLFFVLLIGLAGNVGQAVSQKIEVQNAADATAYSGAVWVARGMNAVTVTNHVIGELMALVVLHEAFGGKALDENKPHGPKIVNPLNLAITGSYGTAQTSLPIPAPKPPGPVEESEIRAQATLFDSKVQLKALLAGLYLVHGAGGALEKFPPTAGIGQVICDVAWALEGKVVQEYITLDAIDELARAISESGLKEFVIDLTGMLMQYERAVVQHAPQKSRAGAEQIAQANQTTGALFPEEPQLPLAPQDESVDIERSQLVRASYPWVLAWRKPIREAMFLPLFLSGARGYYRKYTHQYATEKAQEVREQQGLNLFVLKDFKPPNVEKFHEPWVNDSRRADELFTLMGFARRDFSPLFSPAVYKTANQGGMVAYAQAMIHNANPNLGDSDGNRQAVVGWDTLNWLHDPAVYEHAANPDNEPEPPQIRINWQVKLIPVTRLREARGALPAAFRSVLERTLPEIEILQTH
jgi:hypothetical protein